MTRVTLKVVVRNDKSHIESRSAQWQESHWKS